MNKKFKALIVLLFTSTLAISQTAALKGKITSAKSREVLIGVTVIADSSATATTSGINGDYSLILLPGKHHLFFKMIGMAEKKISVELKAGETKTLHVSIEESAKELGVVVVSAGKFEQRIEDVTVSMAVLSRDIVENKNTTTMEDIIDQIPGVNVVDGQANIRGGSGWSYGAGSRVAILVDDLPILTADAADAKWNFLPVENLEQIEVIKGASSALFGSSALNGVINIRTAYPTSTPKTKLNFFTGYYDTEQKINLNDTVYDLNWGGKIPNRISGMNFFHSRQIKNFDLVVGGNMLMDQGFRQGENESRGRFNFNTRYRSQKIDGLSYGLNFNTMFTEGTLAFIWLNDTTGAYRPLGGTASATTTLSDYTTYRTNADPFFTYANANGIVHKVRTRYFKTVNLNSTNQESTGEVYYGEYQFQKHFSEQFTITAGALHVFSKVKSELYLDHDGDNTAVYAQADAKWRKFTFAAGGRLEKYRIDSLSDKFTPVVRAGINYHLLKATYLRTSFGQGYRYPAIAEKYIETDVGSLGIFPNDSLNSEKGYSAEFAVMQGIKVSGWKGYFDVAIFQTEYQNMIEFAFSIWRQPPPFTHYYGFKALNIGDTKIRGVDVSLSGKGKILGINTTIIGGYTYIDPVQTSYDSSYIKAVISIPGIGTNGYLGSDSSTFLKYRFQHMVKADVEFGYKKFAVGVSVRYTSYMKNIDKLFVTDFFGSQISPGVKHYRNSYKEGDTIYDLRASYEITANTKFTVNVRNLTNHIFMQRPADMQPPRVFSFQLGVTF
jgi:iron complex outermembrane receptor protein